jgi:hypothetical protein
VAAGREPGLDEGQEQRRLVGDHAPVVDLDPGHVPRLGGVPTLLLDPLAQRFDVEVVPEGTGGRLQAVAHPIASSPSSTS